jgi:ElaB/YqjD/DUF883 family membrane-anchored ribosome-binding protein
MGFASQEAIMEATAYNTQDKARNAANEVSEDFTALRNDVARLAESVRKLAADEFGTSVEDLQMKAGEQITVAERAIRRNPTQAAMIAAGVGFLVGLIMTR